MRKTKRGLLGALLFGAISNLLFFGPHEWDEELKEIEAVGGSLQFEMLPKELDLFRVKEIFRNSSANVATREQDSLEAALAEELGVYKDDWKLIGSIIEEDVRKAFIISSEGLIKEIGVGDFFGFENEALEIEDKYMSYLTESGQKKVLMLYEYQKLRGENEQN